MYGRKVWFFPDGDRPPPGNSPMQGHESIVILNPNAADAHVLFTLYYEDAEPARDIPVTVGAERVRCVRTHDPEVFGAYAVPVARQYALKAESDVPVIIQYGRLDARQDNLAYYTTMGYPGEEL